MKGGYETVADIKDALIDALDENVEFKDALIDALDENVELTHKLRAALTRLSALEERCGDVEGMWISVKDRLPEKESFVMAYDKNAGILLVDYSGEYNPGHPGFYEVWTGMRYSVTHWQPLPPSPSGEREEQG